MSLVPTSPRVIDKDVALCFFGGGGSQRLGITITLNGLKMQNETPNKYQGGYQQINKTLNVCAFEDYLEAQLSHLPEIADIEVISPRVIRVLGQNAGKVGCYVRDGLAGRDR